MFRRSLRTLAACFCLTLISAALPTPVSAAAKPEEISVERGLDRLHAAAGGSARIELSRATGAARLVVFEPGRVALASIFR